ncbi:coiled-coil domain-containing protein 40 [Caerostris extrusa]|uniref:Coiled-coil domain-containing protein 40 n=1 Tax=Caerostris extrusa TaxID=172846 RepID=A0AAV4NGS2_CAEEX|nr:coiled-coil domain-containing protein 40 [Caerostris extrusa]
MEKIQVEKQQIVHQWKQSVASLGKQDNVLKYEDDASTLNMDISACKKSVRKELERNEQLVLQLEFKEAEIIRGKTEMRKTLERQADLEENITVLDKTVEINEQELKNLNDNKVLKEKNWKQKTEHFKSYMHTKNS